MLNKFSISGREKERKNSLARKSTKRASLLNVAKDKDTKKIGDNLSQEILNSLLRIGKKNKK